MTRFDQAVALAAQFIGLSRVAALERFKPRVDPHLAQPFTLHLHSHQVGTMLTRDILEQFEIDMGGDVGLTGVREDIDLLVALQCLQG